MTAIANLINAHTFDYAGIQCVSYEEPDGVYTWYGGKFGRLVVTTGCACRDDAESMVKMFFDKPLEYLENVRFDYDKAGDPPEELVDAIADAKQRIEEALAAYKTMSDRYASVSESAKFVQLSDRYGSGVASQIWTEETIGRD